MKYSTSVKPISYLKTHASRMIRELSDNQGTLIVTHNGQAKAIVQDIRTFERTQEALALLKILTQSQRNIQRGKAKRLDAVVTSLKRRIRYSKNEKI